MLSLFCIHYEKIENLIHCYPQLFYTYCLLVSTKIKRNMELNSVKKVIDCPLPEVLEYMVNFDPCTKVFWYETTDELTYKRGSKLSNAHPRFEEVATSTYVKFYPENSLKKGLMVIYIKQLMEVPQMMASAKKADGTEIRRKGTVYFKMHFRVPFEMFVKEYTYYKCNCYSTPNAVKFLKNKDSYPIPQASDDQDFFDSCIRLTRGWQDYDNITGYSSSEDEDEKFERLNEPRLIINNGVFEWFVPEIVPFVSKVNSSCSKPQKKPSNVKTQRKGKQTTKKTSHGKTKKR